MTIIITVVLGAYFMVDGGTTPATIIPVAMVIFYMAIIILV
jgi:hypothetical protein